MPRRPHPSATSLAQQAPTQEDPSSLEAIVVKALSKPPQSASRPAGAASELAGRLAEARATRQWHVALDLARRLQDTAPRDPQACETVAELGATVRRHDAELVCRNLVDQLALGEVESAAKLLAAAERLAADHPKVVRLRGVLRDLGWAG